MAPMFFIQGDTIKKTLRFKNLDSSTDTFQVWFTCKSLQQKVQLTYVENTDWLLQIDAETSKNFRIGEFYFDITIVNDNEQETVIYNGVVTVLNKINTL